MPLYKSLESKANVTQEAWIDLTKLNGWVGTARCKKDTLGFIYVQINLIGGTGNAVLAVLPVGYRPPVLTYATGSISSTSAITIFWIDSSGNIQGEYPTGSTIACFYAPFTTT